MVKLLAGSVYEGKLTQSVKNDFKPIIKKAINQFLNEQINDRLQSAMNRYSDPLEDPTEVEEDSDNGVITTEDEVEGYNLVKAIVRKAIDPDRVVMRDTKSYCGVLIDDNNRKPLCRMHFNRSQKYIGIFDGEKKETRHPIETLNDIFLYEQDLLETAGGYVD